MSNNVRGKVVEMSSRDWTGDDGKTIVLHSFKVNSDNRWFRTGTDRPNLNEGDFVEFEFAPKGNRVDLSSIKQIDASEAPPPAPPAAKKSFGGGGAKKKGGENWDARGKYWEDKEKRDIEVVEPRITFCSAQSDAIDLITAALANDCLSFGNMAKGAKLDYLYELVDQTTLRFYKQRIEAAATIREMEGV